MSNGLEPRKHGHWINERLASTNGGSYSVVRCSVCQAQFPIYETNYCPNCGARMDEVEVMGENKYEVIMVVLSTPFGGEKVIAQHERIVRCRDYKHRDGDYCHNNDGFAHAGNFFFVRPDDFCSGGERMDKPSEPDYTITCADAPMTYTCDRSVCMRNEYNDVDCDKCEVKR